MAHHSGLRAPAGSATVHQDTPPTMFWNHRLLSSVQKRLLLTPQMQADRLVTGPLTPDEDVETCPDQ